MYDTGFVLIVKRFSDTVTKRHYAKQELAVVAPPTAGLNPRRFPGSGTGSR